MDPLTILMVLTVSLFAHLIVTGGALAVTLWYAHKEAVGTLAIATAIQKDIQGQIDKMNAEASFEDRLLGAMEDYSKETKAMLDGKTGDLLKKVDDRIADAEHRIVQKQPGGGLGEMLVAGLAGALGGGG